VNDWSASIVSGVYIFSLALLLNAFRGTQVDVQASPTGAIQRSLRFACLISAVGASVHFVIMPMLFGVVYAGYSALTTLLTLWLWYGGYPAIQYWVLRALLHHEGQRFYDERQLEAAVDRGLLYRVGAGYMFPHPLFLEHLATRGARNHD